MLNQQVREGTYKVLKFLLLKKDHTKGYIYWTLYNIHPAPYLDNCQYTARAVPYTRSEIAFAVMP